MPHSQLCSKYATEYFDSTNYGNWQDFTGVYIGVFDKISSFDVSLDPTPRSGPGPGLFGPPHLLVNELSDIGGYKGYVISIVLFAAQNVQSTQTVFSVFRFHRRKDLFRIVNRLILDFVLVLLCRQNII